MSWSFKPMNVSIIHYIGPSKSNDLYPVTVLSFRMFSLFLSNRALSMILNPTHPLLGPFTRSSTVPPGRISDWCVVTVYWKHHFLDHCYLDISRKNYVKTMFQQSFKPHFKRQDPGEDDDVDGQRNGQDQLYMPVTISWKGYENRYIRKLKQTFFVRIIIEY